MRTLICLIIVSLMIGIAYAGVNSPVSPTVSIISPQDGTATNQKGLLKNRTVTKGFTAEQEDYETHLSHW